jgi:effector-binding domain-containing protein
MIDPPKLVDIPARATATIRLTVPRADIRKVMGPAISEVLAVVARQGAGPTGPVFSHHFRMDPEVFDFEVGVPVTHAIDPTGRVENSQLPAGAVAQTTYHGGYEGLAAAWGEFDSWMSSQNVQRQPNLWEFYAAGPESSPDPANWRTELNRPIVA